ncbi:MAG: hypothetical protein ACOY90_09865 [Candidatus Zhuqueibacterota bacterium]
MMRLKQSAVQCLCVVLLASAVAASGPAAGSDDTHQINLSFTLSGHLLFGIGYSYGFEAHHFVQATWFIVPEKGLPFAVNGGYNYFFKGGAWQPNLGLETVIIASPSGRVKRKYLPLITLVPGIGYQFNDTHAVNTRLWLAYFPIKARKKVAPIGLEFKYGNFISR